MTFTAIPLSVLGFFSLSGGEIFIVLAVALLFFGAKRIPELARGLGKGIREFKNATGDIQRDIQKSIDQTQDDLDATGQPKGQPKS